MRSVRLLAVVAPALAACALALAGPADARPGATCTAKAKRAHQAALAAYRKAMPKARAAYFRKHRSAALRKRFVKRQQAKLRKLRTAAACTVPSPRPPPTVTPPAPPAPPPAAPAQPPPPPLDTSAPVLTSAAVDGSTMTVRFNEVVALAGAAFSVQVNGQMRAAVGAASTGQDVQVTLAAAVAGDDVVSLDYHGGVQDPAGNVAPPVSGVVVANATPTPCNFMVGNGGLSGPGAMNEGPTDLALHRPGVGQLRGVVLGVDFPDAPAAEPIASLASGIFPPAATAYAAMSFGRLSLQIAPTAQWFRLPQPSTYYGLKSSDGAGRKDEYVAAAIQAADAQVDFSQYDVVYLVPSAGASADFATGTQRPVGSGFATADGVQVRYAVLLGTQPIARNADAVIHETGHVLGLPDLYGDLTAVGGWDPMSLQGAEFMGWHRWKLGWLDPSQLRCVQPARTVEATLTPLETPGGVKILVAPIDTTRALVVESRQPLGLDARLCDHGVLVYTVSGTVTFPGSPIRVLPARAGTDTDGVELQRCGPRYDAPLDLGPGESSSHHDPATGVRVELMGAANGSYVVRVSR